MVFEEVTPWALERYLGVVIPPPPLYDLPVDEARQYVGQYVRLLADADDRLAFAEATGVAITEDDLLERHEVTESGGRLRYRQLLDGEAFDFQLRTGPGDHRGWAAGRQQVRLPRNDSGEIGWLRRNARAVPKHS